MGVGGERGLVGAGWAWEGDGVMAHSMIWKVQMEQGIQSMARCFFDAECIPFVIGTALAVTQSLQVDDGLTVSMARIHSVCVFRSASTLRVTGPHRLQYNNSSNRSYQ